uniref:cytosolic acyl coenzyme A thioester hydrolase n=1 Tax=Ciona intestinalis TaxID=7719 RepID=UPI0000522693|nr:cytosolic acyl coenzyme A thioester hydrolase [Ciona intestinalis]|eukprot:XP_002129019.1 cytosolic acyl coenzyme A thioester hydrolase [Ciona intestinalis]
MEDIPLVLCRSMQPGDANISGNVHGGTILKMIEEAGMIVGTRHCNVGGSDEGGSLCVLARVERTDFLLPMYVGELAHLVAKVTFCSSHSVEVKVKVYAENVLTGARRMTNSATLWYVPLKSKGVVADVPSMVLPSGENDAAGRERYERQKKERREINEVSPCLRDDWAMLLDMPSQGHEPHTVGYAQSTLIHLVGVQDCGLQGIATGGFTMKLMDEVAGICAVRHCHTNVVTASMDATNFHRSINKGNILHFRSRPIFTSNKSLMIQVVVLVEERNRSREAVNPSSVFCACTAFFTYVSLDSQKKTIPVPTLKLTTPSDHERFEEGKLRYEMQKKMRLTSQM